jgi:4-diphosphocytidyl-2-C-methyl-D-erythritol kinase
MIRPYKINTNSAHILAPAKINLFLKVGERDESNLHRIYTLISPISLADSLTIEVKESTKASVFVKTEFDHNLKLHNDYILSKHPEFQNSLDDISASSGLISRAALAVINHFSLPTVEIAIKLKKSIPLQAGLGGGSADAAGTLLALGKIFQLPFEELVSIGTTLGSDVPALLFRKSVFASGYGEKVREADEAIGKLNLLIIKPPQSVSTAEAYKKLGRGVSLTDNLSTDWELYENDFTAVAFKIAPELENLSDQLKIYHPTAIFLAGSGSALVGVFSSQESVQGVIQDLQKLKKSGVFLTSATLLDAKDELI